MTSLARSRLAQERKEFRKSRPFGFVAKPECYADGSVNLLRWNCIVPGKDGTIWEGGRYPVTLLFKETYPSSAPVACFPRGFFHPNIYPDGHVCLSILNDDPDLGGSWAPSLTVQQILLGIQGLLDEPNMLSPAQEDAYFVLRNNTAKYNGMVRKQALLYAAAANDDD